MWFDYPWITKWRWLKPPPAAVGWLSHPRLAWGWFRPPPMATLGWMTHLHGLATPTRQNNNNNNKRWRGVGGWPLGLVEPLLWPLRMVWPPSKGQPLKFVLRVGSLRWSNHSHIGHWGWLVARPLGVVLVTNILLFGGSLATPKVHGSRRLLPNFFLGTFF